jgi:DNA-binding NarL/FixJ family response regulator
MTVALRFRVGLVERRPMIRDALRALLESSGTIVAVGDAAEAGDVLTMIESAHPDATLLCLDGIGEREMTLIHQIPQIAEQSNVLLVTSETDVGLHTQAIELGARGVVLMDQPGAALVKAVQKVCAGEIWLDRARTAGVLSRLTRRRSDDDPETMKVESLTPRERQILMLVTEGLTNREIAERLFISEATARNHLTSILDKLDVTDRFQLTVYAFRHGLVLCPQTPAMLRMAAKMGATLSRTPDHSSEPHSRPKRQGDT